MSRFHVRAGAVCRLSLIAAALALGTAAPAHAVLITDAISVSGNAVAGPDNDSFSSNGTSTASGSAGAFSFGGNADSRARGVDTGRYFAEASARGASSADSQFSWQRTVTNTDDDAQAITFDAFIYGGSLTVGAPADVASYDWSISYTRGGERFSIFESDVTLTGTGLDDADNDGLGSVTSPNRYSWGSRQLSDISLGVLASGESLTINYDLATLAVSTGTGFGLPPQFHPNEECSHELAILELCITGIGDFDPCSPVEVDRVEFLRELEHQCFSGSSVFTGDPSGIGALPLGSSIAITGTAVSTPTPVSEPTMLPLAALALFGGFAALRRRAA